MLPARWIVKSKANKKFRVRLDDCNKTHAKSVLQCLLADEHCPSDLKLRRRWRRG